MTSHFLYTPPDTFATRFYNNCTVAAYSAVTSHLRRPYGPLASLARKVDFRKHLGQDCAEGLRYDIAWVGREEDEITTFERIRDSIDD